MNCCCARKNRLFFEKNSLPLEINFLLSETKPRVFQNEVAVGDAVRSMSPMRRRDRGARSAPPLLRPPAARKLWAKAVLCAIFVLLNKDAQ